MSKPSDAPAPSLRTAVKAFVFRQLRLALGLGFAVVLAINGGYRWAGGSVSLVSLSHLRERARALGAYAVHRVRCHCPADVTGSLRSAAARHRVPFRLVLSVAKTESSLIHTRMSSTGAMGLMQLMPETARELGVDDPFDVEQNLDGGVRYLKRLLKIYRGNTRRALAAYNAGPARIPQRGPLTMPDETRSYVARVLGGM